MASVNIHILTIHGKILKWEKIDRFGELWAICQLFLLVILLATEVTKQLPFNSLNVSYSAYYSTSLPAILLAHTDTERFTRSFTKVTPVNRIDFYTMNLGISKASNCRSWLTNHEGSFSLQEMCKQLYTLRYVLSEWLRPTFAHLQRYL